jgi:hypothetical protein
MTGVVLALAGLAAGDGGPGMGAATAAIRATLQPDVRWEGEVWMEGMGRVHVYLEGGRLSLENDKFFLRTTAPLAFHADGTGTISAKHRFTYSLEGHRLVLRGIGKSPLVLRPSAPRKP